MSDQPVSTLDEETLRQAISRAREQLASIEQQQSELSRAAALVESEIKLLEQLIGLRRGVATEPVSPVPVAARVAMPGAPPSGGKHSAVETVVSELAVVGRPVHISDLMRLLKEKHVRLPGAGAQANLIAMLRRDERIMRPSRGMYALRAWGLTDMDATPRRKRRKIRRRVRVQPED